MSASTKKQKRHIISILVEDKFGVMQRVSGVFSKRGFNIDSITVGKSEQVEMSRIIISFKGSQDLTEKIIKQLNKLVDTIKVLELKNNVAAREICLVKVHVKNFEARNELMNYAKVYEAKILDVSQKALIIEVTGDTDKIKNFLDLLRPFGIKEVNRTGITAIEKS
ncbi:MAG: acetolactate synthase small subunit [Candidatus Micrarchaeia archaeon]